MNSSPMIGDIAEPNQNQHGSEIAAQLLMEIHEGEQNQILLLWQYNSKYD